MAKKLIIGVALAAVVVGGAAIAAQPILDKQMNAAIDQWLAQANQTESIKASRTSSKLHLWSRSVQIDGISFEHDGAPKVSVKVPQLKIEGIGATVLVKALFSDESGGRDIIEAFQQIPLDSISAALIEFDITVPGQPQVDKTLYRDTVVSDIRNGIAKSLTVATTEKPEQSGDKAFRLEPMKIGKTVYNDVDLALNAAIFLPKTKLSQLNEMRQLFSSATIEPYSMKGATTEPKTNMVMEIGASSMGAARVNPSLFDFSALLNALESMSQQTAKSEEDPKVIFGTLSVLSRTISAFELDELKIENARILVEPAEGDAKVEFKMGKTTIAGVKAGQTDLLEINDLSFDLGEEGTSFKRAGVSKLDYTGFLQLLSDDKAMLDMVENGPKNQTILQMIPRGEIFLDGLEAKGGENAVSVGRYRFALAGAKGNLPETISLDVEDFKAPLAEDDERFEVLRNYGMTELSGDTALKLSYEQQNSVLRLERFHLGIDKLAAADLSASFGDLKIDFNQEGTEFSALADYFFASKPIDLQLKLEDRDGGINKVLQEVAGEQGADLATVKEALSAQAELFGSVLLGDQADKVIPAVTSFLKEPKAITVKAKPKTDELTTIDLFIELQSAPESAAELLNFEATVP